MSDTPRTDEQLVQFPQRAGIWVDSRFAREIERENAELREHLKTALHWMEKVNDYCPPRMQDLSRMAQAWVHITKAMKGTEL